MPMLLPARPGQSGGADGSGGGPKIGCAPHDVLVASTGVIGEVLETAPLLKALEEADGMADWQAAARAIMTTDTFPKLASASAKFGNRTVTLTGIAKGSGMIAPIWRPCWLLFSPMPLCRLGF